MEGYQKGWESILVSSSLTEEVQLTEGLAAVIEEFRVKHGSKQCDRKDVRGVYTLTLYGNNHVHMSKFGDISFSEILLCVMELANTAQGSGVVTQFG